MLTEMGTRPIMAQRYIPEIVEGDKRICWSMVNPFRTVWRVFHKTVKSVGIWRQVVWGKYVL